MTLAALSALSALRPRGDAPPPEEKEGGKRLRLQPAPTQATIRSHPAIGQAIEIIRREFADSSLTLQRVARRVGLSPGQLGRRFRRDTGAGFSRQLMDARMDVAAALLQDPCLSIKQISARVGYE
ncbi:MAG: helix-turn-helix transcriptional regulator, partial [Gemmatimonadaceae bacterium]|nr:helix-turn-helix transcriptional regulator [Gemmatimonadaceae bacterium]